MKRLSILKSAMTARRAGGVGYLQQAMDIVRVKRLNPTVGASDYYTYRLYDRSVVSPDRHRDYLGWRVEESLAEALNPRQFVLPAWDKLTMWILASAAGLPVPALHAVYRPGRHLTLPTSPACLVDKDGLRKFLDTRTEWPLFAKPSYSQQGYGAMLLSGVNVETRGVITSEGEMSIDAFIDFVATQDLHGYYRPAMGYLFQEALKPHPTIATLLGTSAISGVRLVCLRLADRVEIIATVWRIPTGTNAVDNRRGDTLGNLFSAVDPGSGLVRLVVDRFWPNAVAITHHPKTGHRLTDFVLPCWQQTVDLVKDASSVFPLMRIQHWDVALTDRGPVLLELNDKGSIDWLQLAGTGLLRSSLKPLLQKHGNRKHAPWIGRI